MRRSLMALALLLGGAAQAEDPVDVEALLRRSDDLYRGASSTSVMEMQVKTQRYERTMRMRTWAKGTERTLIRILEPAKDAGITTLKVDDNLWNYLPKVDRTMKVPAGMMSGAWMGSHVTNDDLVKESRLSDDFTWEVTQRPTDGEGSWVIALTPRPDAPVVWGKVVSEIRADELPVSTKFYDEKGALVRTMSFDGYQEMDGRTIPTTMTLKPEDKPGEYTRVTYVEIDFDADVPEETFSLQALRN